MSKSAKSPKAARAEYRLQAMTGIAGGKPICACCGEKRVWALVIDHIYGGGSKQRNALGLTSTYRYVRREYKESGIWPTHKYQILCATCNHGKRMNNNVCPHNEEGMMSKKNKEILKSYFKVFAATVLALFIADGADVFSVDFSELKTYVSSGIASVLPLLITALDPKDTRFGVNAEE